MALGSPCQGGKELAFRCQTKGLALLERAAFPSPLSLTQVGTSLGKEERDDNKGLSGVFSFLKIFKGLVGSDLEMSLETCLK